MKNILFVILSLLVFNIAYAAEATAKGSKWVMVAETNPIDDSSTVYGYILANKSTSRGRGVETQSLFCGVTILITSVHVVWGAYPEAECPAEDGKGLDEA